MTYRKLSRSMGAAALLLVLVAPAVQAQPRDTGVGREIAEQGNIALRVIRAQARVAMLFDAPSLVDVRVRRAPSSSLQRASGNGTTSGATTTVRAAE